MTRSASNPVDPVADAVAWLADTPRSQRGSAIPELRHRFGLTLDQATVVRANNLRLARAQ